MLVHLTTREQVQVPDSPHGRWSLPLRCEWVRVPLVHDASGVGLCVLAVPVRDSGRGGAHFG
eukprot:8724157-Alexandrium_andersonii.AAC.1